MPRRVRAPTEEAAVWRVIWFEWGFHDETKTRRDVFLSSDCNRPTDVFLRLGSRHGKKKKKKEEKIKKKVI